QNGSRSVSSHRDGVDVRALRRREHGGAKLPLTDTPVKRIRIGEVLVEEGMLSQEQLNRALAEQKATGRMLGEMLVEQGVIDPALLVQALGRRLGIVSCHLRHGLID